MKDKKINDQELKVLKHGIAWILMKAKAEDVKIPCPECKSQQTKVLDVDNYKLMEIDETGEFAIAKIKCNSCLCEFKLSRKSYIKRNPDEF